MVGKRPDETVILDYDGRGLRRGLKDAASRIRGFFSLTKGIIAAAGVAMATMAVKAFAVQEQGEKRLRRALTATGQYSDEVYSKLKRQAGEIQKATKLGDEAAMGMMSSLIQVGRVAPEQAAVAATTIAAMAEQTGRPINRLARSFSEQLAQAGAFGTATLGEIEKYFDEATVSRLRNMKKTGDQAALTGAIVDAMNAKFAGGADVIKGSTDEWTQLGNLWGDLIEVVGQFVHELLIGLMPALKSVLETVISWKPTFRLIAHVAANFFSYLYNSLATTTNLFRAFPRAFSLAFATAFETAVNLVIRGANYLLSQVPEWFPGGGKQFKEYDFTSKLEKQFAEAAARVKKYSGRMREDVSGIWRGFTDGDAVLAEKDEQQLGDTTNEEQQSSSEATQDLTKIEDEIEEMKARHDALKQAELEFSQEMRKVEEDRAAARKLIQTDGNLEEARLLQERADERERVALETLEKERAEHAERAAERLAEYELEQEAYALARETKLEQDEETIEALKAQILREREIKETARADEIAARIEAHRREQKDEMLHGKTMAKILKFGRSKDLKLAGGFIDKMASLNAGGSKKMQKIQEAAERARLVLQLATKPFEAYAETSSLYPWPVGPALGALHAVAVAAQIGSALRAVGGGGGGPAMPGSSIGGDASGQDGDTAEGGGEDDTERPPQVINLDITLNADGHSIAKIVEQHIVQTEDA